MTYAEIEALDAVGLRQQLALQLFVWHEARIEGSGYQRNATGNQWADTSPRIPCPDWTYADAWRVVEALRCNGFRVNIAEVAPNVGEVIVVEHSSKHPQQERIEVTRYYGLSEGMDTCAVALCRAALMALATPMRLKKASVI